MKFDKSKFYGHPMFYEILENLANLHSTKNYQYADKGNPLSNFEKTGALTAPLFKDDVDKPLAEAMALMAKQIVAVYDVVGSNKKGCEEMVDDKFRDIAVYSIICMILIKEKDKNKTVSLDDIEIGH